MMDKKENLEEKSWVQRTEKGWKFISPPWQEPRPDRDQGRWDDEHDDVR